MLSRVSALAKNFSYPGGWRFVRSLPPRSATSYRMASELKKAVGSLDVVIDGGANIGQFSRACNNFFPGAKIFSFEPLPDVASELQKNLSDIESLEVVESALGSADGEADFNRASDSQCSSVLPINTGVDLMQSVSTVESLKVKVRTLDSFFSDKQWSGKTLLKLDLQGYELEALKGASELLKRVDYVLVESGFDQAYHGEPTFDEVWKFLSDQGFVFFRPLNYLTDSNGTVVQMDALFAGNK